MAPNWILSSRVLKFVLVEPPPPTPLQGEGRLLQDAATRMVNVDQSLSRV